MQNFKWIKIDKGSMLTTDDESKVILCTQRKMSDIQAMQLIENAPAMLAMLQELTIGFSDTFNKFERPERIALRDKAVSLLATITNTPQYENNPKGQVCLKCAKFEWSCKCYQIKCAKVNCNCNYEHI